MGTLKTTNIQTITGSGTLTLGTSGETLVLGSGVTSQLLRPAWFVHLNADQTGITDNVATKVQFDTEVFDTDNIYDNSTNYRITIPSGKAGKYYIESSVFVRHNASTLNRAIAYIYKNGGIVNQVFLDFRNNPIQKTNVTVSAILDLAVNDYIEIYGFGDSTDSNDVEFGGEPNQKESYFQGFRIGT